MFPHFLNVPWKLYSTFRKFSALIDYFPFCSVAKSNLKWIKNSMLWMLLPIMQCRSCWWSVWRMHIQLTYANKITRCTQYTDKICIKPKFICEGQVVSFGLSFWLKVICMYCTVLYFMLCLFLMLQPLSGTHYDKTDNYSAERGHLWPAQESRFLCCCHLTPVFDITSPCALRIDVNSRELLAWLTASVCEHACVSLMMHHLYRLHSDIIII